MRGRDRLDNWIYDNKDDVRPLEWWYSLKPSGKVATVFLAVLTILVVIAGITEEPSATPRATPTASPRVAPTTTTTTTTTTTAPTTTTTAATTTTLSPQQQTIESAAATCAMDGDEWQAETRVTNHLDYTADFVVAVHFIDDDDVIWDTEMAFSEDVPPGHTVVGNTHFGPSADLPITRCTVARVTFRRPR